MDYNFAVKHFNFDNGVISRVDGGVVNINTCSGYLYVNLMDLRVSMHRLVYWLSYGDTDMEIDHIDRDKFNNSPDNLRACTRADNCKNVGIIKTNTSGFKGVTWNRRANKWAAQIRANKKRYYLGVFSCPIEAAKAHDKKCLELHGEFALTNKMMNLY